MRGQIKDKLYYYFAEKNWGVRREYGPYVDAHREEHAEHPWKHRWMLVKLNWHYRVLRKTDRLYFTAGTAKERCPYLEGSESEAYLRRKEVWLARDLLQYDIISFDIFDTLVLRPFAAPTDLFMIVGKRLGKLNFYTLRKEAEQFARAAAFEKNGSREVTLRDIYTVLEQRTGIPAEEGMRTELETELDYCFANPYMQRVYRMVREQGTPVILVSDMYLPAELMEKILHKCGYTDYEKLYVSCDYGVSKRSRELYNVVKAEHPGKTIVHVGDNMDSDIRAAKSAGLEVRFYQNCHEIGNKHRATYMSPLVGSAYAGIVNTYLHNGAKTYSVYYEYGFIYGGLYILGFCNWIHRRVKEQGIEKVLFLSRDGEIYQRVFNMLFDDVPNEYFLWSRIANMKYTLGHNRDLFLNDLISLHSKQKENTLSVGALFRSMSLLPLESLLQQYGLKENEVISASNLETLQQLFLDNWDRIEACYKEEKEQVIKLIQNKVTGSKRIAVVDIGWRGNSWASLKYLIQQELDIKCDVFGYVAGTHTGSNMLNGNLMEGMFNAYIFSSMHNRSLYDYHNKTNMNMNNNCLFEMFTQAAHPSFAGLNKNGDYCFDIPEVENKDLIHEIHQGIIDFCIRYSTVFHADPWMYNISGHDAYCPFRSLLPHISYFKSFFSDYACAITVGGCYDKQCVSSLAEVMKGYGV